jgi:hypothetical protein
MDHQWAASTLIDVGAIEVAQGIVGVDVLALDLELELRKERPAVRAGGIGKQLLEGGFGGAFVFDALVAVGLEGLVVGPERLSRLFSTKS